MSQSCVYCQSIVPEGSVFCTVCGAPRKAKDATPKDFDESEIEDVGVRMVEAERPFIKFRIVEKKKPVQEETSFFTWICSFF